MILTVLTTQPRPDAAFGVVARFARVAQIAGAGRTRGGRAP